MARSAARRAWYVFVAAMLVVHAAYAQSMITGTVRDVSGAAMPGVTVEAASPVLIEKVRSVVTDGNGSYRITDLRPGVYSVTFTLPGFSTYRRDGLELPTDFTATINAELQGRRARGDHHGHRRVAGRRRVEHLARAGAVARRARRDPDRPHHLRDVAAGHRRGLNVPDVGGSRAMQQTYMSTRGLTSANNIVQIDGLMINGLDGDGAVQQYINNPMIQEMSYTDGRRRRRRVAGRRPRQHRPEGRRQPAPAARSSAPGPTAAGSPTTMTDALRAARPARRGQDQEDLRLQRRLRRPDQARQAVVLRRRPLERRARADRRHVLRAAGRDQRRLPGGPRRLRAGHRRSEDQERHAAPDVADQSPRNKFSVYYDEIDKFRGHGMNAGDDPDTASQIWTSPRYNDAALQVHQHGHQLAAVRRRVTRSTTRST